MLASHRWLGGNTTVPFYYGYSDQLQKTEAFLRRGTLNVDVFAIRKVANSGKEAAWTAPPGYSPFEAHPGDIVEIAVVIQNKGIGHSLVPEQRDIFESWVEFSVRDAAGKVVVESGDLEPDGSLDPLAHSFVTRLLDRNGSLLHRHEVWLRHTVATDSTIPSGQSVVVCYRFQIPVAVDGPLSMTARVNYRHLNKIFTDFALGDGHAAYPVVEMASQTRVISTGESAVSQPMPDDYPEWMRWNNFGIALLNAQQYPDATAAFDHVAELRPEYADAYTNLGLVYFRSQNYQSAEASLRQALHYSATDPRALYYQALVRRARGNLAGAVGNLETVAARYPQSADVHRELGLSYYLLRNYTAAAREYRIVQSIDPDDLLSHYYLSIIYKLQGGASQSADEAARFVDEKSDPMADTASLGYLSRHTEISEERHPWHVHDLSYSAQSADRHASRQRPALIDAGTKKAQ